MNQLLISAIQLIFKLSALKLSLHGLVIFRHVIINLIILFFALLANAQAQTIYTWVDEKGTVHFSHHPSNLPKNNTIKPATLSSINTVVTPPPSTKKQVIKTASQYKRSIPKKTSKRQLIEACRRHKEKLEKIQTALRRGYKEPQGNRYREQRRKYSGFLSRYCR